MGYEEITVTHWDGIQENHVVITNEDGSMESFPVDESNPRYIQFLEESK